MVVDTASAFVQSSFLCLCAPHCSLVGLNAASIVVLQCLALPYASTNACASILYGYGKNRNKTVHCSMCTDTADIASDPNTETCVSIGRCSGLCRTGHGLTDGYSYLYPYKWTRVLLN